MAGLLERDAELAAVDDLLHRGGALVVEAGAGLGKTTLLDAAAGRAAARGREVLRARGTELEAGFAFGVARGLFERRLARTGDADRDALLAGHAGAVRALLLGEVGEDPATDTSFAVLHGLYWLAANLADLRPLLLVVDDAHWADAPSLRWLAHLLPRIEGPDLAVLLALRPGGPGGLATPVIRPAPLSEAAVDALARRALGEDASADVRASVWRASRGNPLYADELLRALARGERLPEGGRPGIAHQVLTALDPAARAIAGALAVLGDGCELRHAAAMRDVPMAQAISAAARLVRFDVLAADDPPRFLHPVVREAVEGALATDERDALHRRAARLLHADRAPPGQVAAHVARVHPVGDPWVAARLREAAGAAMASGAPQAAARLLERALREPPPTAERIGVLRDAARAEACAGSDAACRHLEEALQLTGDPLQRAEIALEIAETYAALFRWVEAVDVIERALAELGTAAPEFAAHLEGELVVAGLHDARRATRVPAVLERLAARAPRGSPAEALATAQGMAMVLAGRPVDEAAAPLQHAIARAAPDAENWDTRAALLWSLVTAERYDAVEAALGPMVAEAGRSGSARALVAVYSTLGLLKLRLGALPEADAAARVALRVLQEGDFGPGLAFAVTVLAEIAIEAGELGEADDLLALLPAEGWTPGVGTVLIPAARGRLRLAQGRPADALRDFQTCLAMFSSDVWGTPMRDVGYLLARSGSAQALLRLGRPVDAQWLADDELADMRRFGAPRGLGIALRVAGLTARGDEGLALLEASVGTLHASPALLERARTLAEWGRRCGARATAPAPASRSPRRWTSRRAVERGRLRRTPAWSSRPAVRGRGARGAPASRR